MSYQVYPDGFAPVLESYLCLIFIISHGIDLYLIIPCPKIANKEGPIQTGHQVYLALDTISIPAFYFYGGTLKRLPGVLVYYSPT